MLISRKGAASDFLAIRFDRSFDFPTEIVVCLHEAGVDFLVKPKHVLGDQDLPIAARARTDADGRDFDGSGNSFRQRGRHALDYQRERAGSFRRQGVFHRFAFVALNARAWRAAEKATCPKLYWDLRTERTWQAKRQAQFTPAVSLVMAISMTSPMIDEIGPICAERPGGSCSRTSCKRSATCWRA